MKINATTACAALLCIALGGCASPKRQDDWVTLLDSAGGLDNFTPVGEANWVVTEQGVEAQEKRQEYAFLMSKQAYGDFVLRVEFWVSADANSGVYMRCQDRENPTDLTCYEANIYDQRPDQTYATGSIVHVAPAPLPVPQAGGRWNIYEIRLQGPRLKVNLNGQTTVDVEDSRLRQGYFGLQFGQGTVRVREVKIKSL